MSVTTPGGRLDVQRPDEGTVVVPKGLQLAAGMAKPNAGNLFFDFLDPKGKKICIKKSLSKMEGISEHSIFLGSPI